MSINGRDGAPWEESSLEKVSLSFSSLTQGALQRLQMRCGGECSRMGQEQREVSVQGPLGSCTCPVDEGLI